VIGEGIPEIPDRGSAIEFPRGSSNQSPKIEHPRQEILEDYWHIFNQMVQPNQPRAQTSTLEYLIVNLVANSPMKEIPLQLGNYQHTYHQGKEN
jgi:hypothetical protein